MSDNPIVEFPDKLCKPIAEITSGFSFAYLQELFVASLLDIAHKEDEDSYPDQGTAQPIGASADGLNSSREDLDRYKLWRAIKRTVKVLRHEIEDPDSREKGLLGSLSDFQTKVVTNANPNAFPIPLASEQSGGTKTGLAVDEQIDKMQSGLWQKKNRSRLNTSLPLHSEPHSGSRPYPHAFNSTFFPASSHIPNIAGPDRPVMLTQDEELAMLFQSASRRDNNRIVR